MHADKTLDVQRIKAQRQTMRDVNDGVLPDDALVPYIGATDSAFFENMFSLDHDRLVSGGKDILNASDDVGRVLFQASAGIASLGKVVEDLQSQADALWAPRKSGERLYYKAAARFEEATATLKAVAVRTKEWVEAHGQVEALEAQMDAERQTQRELEQKRASLERVRRLAPVLSELRECEAALSDLGVVVDLPPDAQKTVEIAEAELSRAREVCKLRAAAVQDLEAALKAIQLDPDTLLLKADITALEGLRATYKTYPRDLERRANEVAQAWSHAQVAMAQLGWTDANEQSVRTRMPTVASRFAIDRLVKSYGGVSGAARTLRQATGLKALEVSEVEKQLAELPEKLLPASLIQARTRAAQLGDIDLARQRHAAALASASAAKKAAFEKLGEWSRDPAALRAIKMPGPHLVEELNKEKQVLQADKRHLESRLREQRTRVAKANLALKQYQEMHHPVTAEDVAEARAGRDGVWGQIKTGVLSVADGSPALEAGLRRADELADARNNKAEQEAEFQNRRHQLAQDELEEQRLVQQVLDCEKRLNALSENWLSMATAADLPNMPLELIASWAAHREAALAAFDLEAAATLESSQFEAQVTDLSSSLAIALAEAGRSQSAAGTLPGLISEAQLLTNEAEVTRGRGEALNAQLSAARTALVSQDQSAKAAEEEFAKWQRAWKQALEAAGLPDTADISVGEGALRLMDEVEKQLDVMREIRVKRIETMRADLVAYEAEVSRVASEIDGGILGEPPDVIVSALAQRLSTALSDQKDHDRMTQDLAAARKHLQAATEAITTTTARLQPLLSRLGTDDMAVLRDAILKSDRQRNLASQIERLRRQVRESGDGYSREALEQEIDAADLSHLGADTASLTQRLTDSQETQKQLSASLATAKLALERIAGSDAAARAEADRQNALAAMADATERYVRVATASRLLRWAIDQYREQKQGPLLARAGAIFSQLTLGSFQKLSVDYDQTTPTLDGMRPNGALVGIAGMSDGSRDQLFLALRLAALELHLQTAHAMPFIADDLFINFDDGRSEAGLRALAELAEKTQVIFLSHHEHFVERVRTVFGDEVNVVQL
jgi:uncharacterized protein YhaN